MLNVSKAGSHVGMIVEGATFQVVVGLDTYVKKYLIMGIAGLVPYPLGLAKLGKGLRDVKELVLNPTGRRGVPKVLIVISFSKSPDDVIGPAKALKDLGVETFSVGLGPKCSQQQLEAMASSPRDKHVIRANFVHSFAVVNKIMGKISEKYFPRLLKAKLLQILGRLSPNHKIQDDMKAKDTDFM